MRGQNTSYFSRDWFQNRILGPLSYRDFWETGPWSLCWMAYFKNMIDIRPYNPNILARTQLVITCDWLTCHVTCHLFLIAHSFPQATLAENCSLLRTDNVREQISYNIFASNGGYCLYIFAKMEAFVFIIFNFFFQNTCGSFKNWGILLRYSQVTRFDHSRASKNIWWIFKSDMTTPSRSWFPFFKLE